MEGPSGRLSNLVQEQLRDSSQLNPLSGLNHSQVLSLSKKQANRNLASGKRNYVGGV